MKCNNKHWASLLLTLSWSDTLLWATELRLHILGWVLFFSLCSFWTLFKGNRTDSSSVCYIKISPLWYWVYFCNPQDKYHVGQRFRELGGGGGRWRLSFIWWVVIKADCMIPWYSHQTTCNVWLFLTVLQLAPDIKSTSLQSCMRLEEGCKILVALIQGSTTSASTGSVSAYGC